MPRRGPSRSSPSKRCATSATFFGRSSMRYISRTCSRDGRLRTRFASRAFDVIRRFASMCFERAWLSSRAVVGAGTSRALAPEVRDDDVKDCVSLDCAPCRDRTLIMPPPQDSSQPRLAAGCRWGGTEEERVILFPEGAIKLQGTGREVLEHCDGQHTFGEIISELQSQFGEADPQKIRG